MQIIDHLATWRAFRAWTHPVGDTPDDLTAAAWVAAEALAAADLRSPADCAAAAEILADLLQGSDGGDVGERLARNLASALRRLAAS